MSKVAAASKSQVRAASLLDVSIDADDYTAAGAALEAAGVPKDGLPTGLDWRAAGKLADDELVARLGRSAATTTASDSLAARKAHSAFLASTTARERRNMANAAALRRLGTGREEYSQDGALEDYVAGLPKPARHTYDVDDRG